MVSEKRKVRPGHNDLLSLNIRDCESVGQFIIRAEVTKFKRNRCIFGDNISLMSTVTDFFRSFSIFVHRFRNHQSSDWTMR